MLTAQEPRRRGELSPMVQAVLQAAYRYMPLDRLCRLLPQYHPGSLKRALQVLLDEGLIDRKAQRAWGNPGSAQWVYRRTAEGDAALRGRVAS